MLLGSTRERTSPTASAFGDIDVLTSPSLSVSYPPHRTLARKSLADLLPAVVSQPNAQGSCRFGCVKLQENGGEGKVARALGNLSSAARLCLWPVRLQYC